MTVKATVLPAHVGQELIKKVGSGPLLLVLSDVGRYAKALAALEEAVTLARKFADEDPARQRDSCSHSDQHGGCA